MQTTQIVLFLSAGFGAGALLTIIFFKIRERSGKILDQRGSKQDLELHGKETKISEPEKIIEETSTMVPGPEKIIEETSTMVPGPEKITEGSGPLTISIPTANEWKHISLTPSVFSPLWKDVEPSELSKKVERKTESVLHANRYPSLGTNSQLAQKYLASIEAKNRKKITIIDPKQADDSAVRRPVIPQKEADKPAAPKPVQIATERRCSFRIFGESSAHDIDKSNSISPNFGKTISPKQAEALSPPNSLRRLSIVTERRCSTKTFAESLVMKDSISADIGNTITQKQVDGSTAQQSDGSPFIFTTEKQIMQNLPLVAPSTDLDARMVNIQRQNRSASIYRKGHIRSASEQYFSTIKKFEKAYFTEEGNYIHSAIPERRKKSLPNVCYRMSTIESEDGDDEIFHVTINY
jgi:hypothetical protein